MGTTGGVAGGSGYYLISTSPYHSIYKDEPGDGQPIVWTNKPKTHGYRSRRRFRQLTGDGAKPKGAAGLFKDQHKIEYIKLKRRGGFREKFDTVGRRHSKHERQVMFSMDDEFVLVHYVKQSDGTWKKVEKDITSEEAFSRMLTATSYGKPQYRLVKIDHKDPILEGTTSYGDIQALRGAIGKVVIPSVADKGERAAFEKRIKATFSDVRRKWGHTGTISEADRPTIVSALQANLDSAEADKISFYKRLEDLLDRAEDQIGVTAGSPLKDGKLPNIDDVTMEDLLKIAEWLKDHTSYTVSTDKDSVEPPVVRYHCTSPDGPMYVNKDDRDNVINIRKLAEEIPARFKQLELSKKALAFLKKQPEGPVSLKAHRDDYHREITERPEENPWIEGKEIKEFVRAVYKFVLPEIKDPALKDDIKAKLEDAIQKSGGKDGGPLGTIDAKTGTMIRKILERKHGELGEKSPLLKKVLGYLKGSEGAIKLMALRRSPNAGPTRHTDDVFVDLPPVPRGRATLSDPEYEDVDEPSPKSRAGLDATPEIVANLSVEGTLERDWGAIIEQWQAKGMMDVKGTRFPSTRRLSDVNFGSRKVPIKGAKDLDYDIDPEKISAVLQKALGLIEQKDGFGKKYLTELARRGIKQVVIVSGDYMQKTYHAQASELAKKAAEVFKTDPKRGAEMMRAAAVKFMGTPAGLYVADEKRILLNADFVAGMKEKDLMSLFLHETGHADEYVRKQTGALTKDRLAEINEHQNKFIKTDWHTVSDHPEVVAKTDDAAEEQRADCFAEFFMNPDNLQRIDPHQFIYFTVMGRRFQSKDIPDPKDTDDTDGEDKVVTAERLIRTKQFDRRAGDMLVWAALNPNAKIRYLLKLNEAGDEKQYLLATRSGYKMIEGTSP